MNKSPRVIITCHWDLCRIGIRFMDKELSMDLSIQEAEDLLAGLRVAMDTYKKLEKSKEDYFSNES